ncbi:MAG: RNA 2',3'-cyclic phosphodiesterase [Bacillota bacterium]|nr:RNA 2',3'-cyclic phosphodiesterase [Bacillota bacterium]
MRLFVAVVPGREVQAELLCIQNELKKLTPDANFTKPQNLHMTVRFIGETPHVMLRRIDSALKSAAKDTAPFLMRLQNMGFFGSPTDATVWAGMGGHIEAFNALCSAVNERLFEEGFGKDAKGPVAHITLVRRADVRGIQIEKMDVATKETSISGMTLFESARINGALTYTPVATYPFFEGS